jgi:hypothetical protein
MDNSLKSILLESLDYSLIRDLILIVFGYAAEYNSEKLDRVINIDSKYSYGIAVDHKRIFVSNQNENCIQVYDKLTNELLYTFGECGIVEGYIGIKYGMPICRKDYKEYNLKTLTLDGIKFYFPTNMTIADNTLYVMDSSNNRIQIFKIHDDKKVSFINCFGEYGIDDDKFNYPINSTIYNDEMYS